MPNCHIVFSMFRCLTAAECPSLQTYRDNQPSCMQLLTGVSDGSALSAYLRLNQLLPENGDESDVCSWRGVTCDGDGVIEKIVWKNKPHSHFEIDWLPPTAQKVQLYMVALIFASLSTRELPREVRYLQIFQCGLRGTVDLETLPDNLQVLDLASNNLVGTVSLLRLPKRMREISFSANQISKVFVRNALLPANFKNAGFSQLKLAVAIVCLDDKMVDTRVNARLDHPSSIDSIE